MKPLFLALILCLSLVAWGQDSAAAAQRLVAGVTPQVVVSVSKHASNADMVEVTVLAPNYPGPLLRQQCEKIGQLTGDPVRGLNLVTQQLGGSLPPLLKAQFATSKLSDYTAGTYDVSKIANAFVGAPAPFTITGMDIQFKDTIPTAATLRTFASPRVAIAGSYDAQQKLLDYRIRLMSQKEGSIDVPAQFVAKLDPQQEQKSGSKRTNGLVIALVIVGALAAGVLVYSLFLLRGNGPGRS